jgi:hypothetical protein
MFTVYWHIAVLCVPAGVLINMTQVSCIMSSEISLFHSVKLNFLLAATLFMVSELMFYIFV